MTSYYFWTEQARRWGECVDFASPMTAWNGRMFEILSECGGDKLAATKQLQKERAEKKKNNFLNPIDKGK